MTVTSAPGSRTDAIGIVDVLAPTRGDRDLSDPGSPPAPGRMRNIVDDLHQVSLVLGTESSLEHQRA